MADPLAQRRRRRYVQALQLVEQPGALLNARAVGDQQHTQRGAVPVRPRRRDAIPSQHTFRRQERVDAVRLALAPIPPAGTLDLHHADPDGLQMSAQAGAVAAGALDPDHHLAAQPGQPRDQLPVANSTRRDRDLAQQLPQLAQRHRHVPMLVGVHHNCDHAYSSASLVEDAAGQSCVKRCQASMKSRRHPGYGGGGRQIQTKARLGQLNHESSRRQPHPPQRAGQHRPTTTLHSSTKPFSRARNAKKCSIRPTSRWAEDVERPIDVLKDGAPGRSFCWHLLILLGIALAASPLHEATGELSHAGGRASRSSSQATLLDVIGEVELVGTISRLCSWRRRARRCRSCRCRREGTRGCRHLWS